MKKVQRMLNFYTYKWLFCANCDVIAKKNVTHLPFVGKVVEKRKKPMVKYQSLVI